MAEPYYLEDMFATAQRLSSSLVADVANERAHVITELTNLTPRHRICGPVLPVLTNRSVLPVLQGMSELLPRHVLLVVDEGNSGDALLGDIILTALRDQRAGGLVCRGRVRDVGVADEIGVPLWASGVTPRACGLGDRMPQMPREVCLNGVMIRPGDWLFGDADGLVRIASEDARSVIKGAALKGRRERACLARMAEGERLLDMMNVPNALRGTGEVRVPF